MFSNLTFNPPFPMPQILGLGITLMVLALLGYGFIRRDVVVWKRVLLALIRLTVLAGLTIVLLRPMESKSVPETGEKPDFAILVDGSASMNVNDEGRQTRIRKILDALEKNKSALSHELSQTHNIQFYEFSDKLTPVSFEKLAGNATGTTTDINSALLAASNAGQGKCGGILILTDGRENGAEDVPPVESHLRSRNIPVWTAAVGKDTQTKDLYVTPHLSQNFVFVRQPASILATVSQSGFNGWYAKINLYREDQYLTSQHIQLKDGNTQVEFPIREERRGMVKYTVTVDPLQGEADPVNNRRSVFVRTVDEKPKVLLIEAEPHWDTRFLLRALKADPNLEVNSIFQLSPTRILAIREKTSSENLDKIPDTQNIGIPRTRQELDAYDCIILGRGIDAVLTTDELKLLQGYVSERGGSVVFSRGKSYSGHVREISDLEPVTWDADILQNVQLELTPDGRVSPLFSFDHPKPTDVILREMPSLSSLTRIKGEKSLSVVLARGREAAGGLTPMAAISYQRYGKGKVMNIGTSGLWKWAFIPDSLSEYDNVYQSFWVQMIRWLVDESDFLPGQDISFRSDRYTYNLGEKIRMVIRARHVDAAQYKPRIELKQPDGRNVVLMPSQDESRIGGDLLYVAYFTPESEGEFEAVLTNNVGQPAKDSTRFTVCSTSTETRLVAADRARLAQIARTTGGSEIGLDQLDTLPGKVRQFAVNSREKLKESDSWDRLPVFAWIAGLLALEWFLRRRMGLV